MVDAAHLGSRFADGRVPGGLVLAQLRGVWRGEIQFVGHPV